MNIEVTSFSLGVIVAVVAILLVALVVMMLKVKKTVEGHSNEFQNVWRQFEESSKQVVYEAENAAKELEKCRNDILNCDLPVLEKKCNSYTDSRIDKLLESKLLESKKTR
jgi:predicted Holliday junction resolvase-like endonuclease